MFKKASSFGASIYFYDHYLCVSTSILVQGIKKISFSSDLFALQGRKEISEKIIPMFCFVLGRYMACARNNSNLFSDILCAVMKICDTNLWPRRALHPWPRDVWLSEPVVSITRHVFLEQRGPFLIYSVGTSKTFIT